MYLDTLCALQHRFVISAKCSFYFNQMEEKSYKQKYVCTVFHIHLCNYLYWVFFISFYGFELPLTVLLVQSQELSFVFLVGQVCSWCIFQKSASIRFWVSCFHCSCVVCLTLYFLLEKGLKVSQRWEIRAFLGLSWATYSLASSKQYFKNLSVEICFSFFFLTCFWLDFRLFQLIILPLVAVC